MDSLILQSEFHGATAASASYPNRMTSSKLCPKGFVSVDPRNDSQVRLARRLKFTLNAGFTEKFDGHLLPRKQRGSRFFFHRNDSLRDDQHDDDSSSLEELGYQLVRAKKDLEDVRHSKAMILKSVRPSITLGEEAASAKKDLEECEEKLASCNNELMRLQKLKDELQKKVESLRDAAETALIQASEKANETMIWGDQGIALKREECQDVIDAEKALQQRSESDVLANFSLSSSADTTGILGSRENEEHKERIVQAGRTDETLRCKVDCIPADSYDQNDNDTSGVEELRYQLVRAQNELENVRDRNAGILKLVEVSVTLDEEAVRAKKDLKDCEEKLASCNDELTRLQILKDELEKEVEQLREADETIQIYVAEVDDMVVSTMIWGEQGPALEREACQDVADAEKALERAESDLLAKYSFSSSAYTAGILGSRETEEFKEIMFSLEELRCDLVRAQKELQNVRERNAGCMRVAELYSKLLEVAASAKKDVTECEEKLASCNEELMRFQILKGELLKEVESFREGAETALIQALVVEDIVNETMIWGEQGSALEREACQDVVDAEKALNRAESDVLANSSFFISARSRENEDYKEITSSGADKLKAEDEGVLES